MKDYPNDYYTPQVYDDMTTKKILCSEFVDGVEIDTLKDSSQEVRDRVGSLMLKLCFKELFEWRIMQTDPNPANFLYDTKLQRLNLIDLGSGRDFSNHFLECYMNIIHGSYSQNKEQVMEYSHKLGFLTGEENKEMLHAHYLGSLAVGEPFRSKEKFYDFSSS